MTPYRALRNSPFPWNRNGSLILESAVQSVLCNPKLEIPGLATESMFSYYSRTLSAVGVGLAVWWFRADNSVVSDMRACIRSSNGPAFTDSHPRPSDNPRSGELLVEVRAAAINPVDYKVPKLMLGPVMGLDFAGVVAAIPAEETKFKVGDEVYGSTKGSMAELALCKSDSIALKPRDLSFEEAAALPTAYITGLQGLRDQGGLQEGDKVLVIGASGGCGIAGVQLAKSLGASEIVGVCSGKNKDMVLEQGATKVVDYTAENIKDVFTEEYFDVVYDTATGSGGGEDYFSISESLLKKNKKNVILNGGAWTWISYFIGLQKANRKLLLTNMNTADLELLSELYNSKQILPPVICKTLPLDDDGVKEGFDMLKSRRTVGKIVFQISSASQ